MIYHTIVPHPTLTLTILKYLRVFFFRQINERQNAPNARQGKSLLNA
jgi:hypothetical protein